MASVRAHYRDHLAPIYLWMAGGFEHAISLGASDVAEFLGNGQTAVDLGAGFGMHTIPLARSGYEVLAIDTSEHLLAELATRSKGLAVRLVEDDLLNFTTHLSSRVDLVLCMGDTLTHLQEAHQIRALMQRVADALRIGGHFLATFRDYTTFPTDERRFIPVRSESDRIHTCFLEEEPLHVRVHDIIHEKAGDTWTMSVSSYRKLRLSREAVMDAAAAAGLRCHLDTGPRGMVRLRADAA